MQEGLFLYARGFITVQENLHLRRIEDYILYDWDIILIIIHQKSIIVHCYLWRSVV